MPRPVARAGGAGRRPVQPGHTAAALQLRPLRRGPAAEHDGGDEDSIGWQTCAPLSVPRRLHGAAAVGGRLYVFGGSPGSGAKEAKLKSTSVECYTGPAADCWEPRCPLPRPMNVGAVPCGGLIFVLPYGDDPMLRYDPVADRFSEVGPLPLPNFHCFALSPGAPPLPSAATPATAAALAQQVQAAREAACFYVVGGTTNGRWTNKAWRYQLLPAGEGSGSAAAAVGGGWQELPNMAAARRRTAAVVAWAH